MNNHEQLTGLSALDKGFWFLKNDKTAEMSATISEYDWEFVFCKTFATLHVDILALFTLPINGSRVFATHCI